MPVMKSAKLPVLSTTELRTLWRSFPDPAVRSVILEVVALREEIQRHAGVMRHISQLYLAIRATWREEVGGQLVGLEHLKALVNDELVRAGRFPGDR
ncbi:hypothetical protein DBB29_00795 [Pandoraea cepalis]|uniref:Uncharacterized protein n=1 Tax=Pandoraea cepalis TaxID=2508294 RepID=A0AAW7MGY0_9BURK|nr:hypothetical protein [Pandoraea cepalis]MDN4576671.1 hypothetical protein [Pandoraea cepalis]